MGRQISFNRFWQRSWALGLESLAFPRPKAQDLRPKRIASKTCAPHAAPRGFSLVELMVTLTVIGILVTMTVPFFQRAIQQSRTNIAAVNLRAIWAAQRMYWLEYQSYASDLATLKSQGVLDPKFDDSDSAFSYPTPTSTDNFALHFQATAVPKSGTWTGQYTLDETGRIDGTVRPPDWSEAILPPEFP